MKKRIVSFILVFAMLASVLPAQTFAALRYGKLPIYIGYQDVDYMADEILKEIPTAGKSSVEKIRAVYDWIITHCTRYENEWDGTYHFDENTVAVNSEAYANRINAQIDKGNAIVRAELTSYFNTYSPFDTQWAVGSYAYNMMLTRNGNCVHYAALLTVLLGHLGFDSRIIEGDFINADGSTYMHKWNYVLVDGQYYWLDVRMDHANYKRTGKINYQYFMITDLARWERSHSWDHTYSNILAQNAGTVVSIYNETAVKFENAKQITVQASRSGSASGEGKYFLDDTACLTAVADGGKPFVGWYDAWGNLVSTDMSYNFQVKTNATFYALFEGDIFADIPANSWYLDNVMEAYERGFVNGTTAVTFEGKGKFTRAMVATILARIAGDDISKAAKSPFADVPEGSWYAEAVNWAYENGIVLGRTESSFAPKDQVTRQEFLTMAVRYLKSKGITAQPSEINYTDKSDISAYAVEALGCAQTMGLVSGYPDGTVLPKGALTRAEGTAIVLRIANYMAENMPADDDDTNIQEQGEIQL